MLKTVLREKHSKIRLFTGFSKLFIAFKKYVIIVRRLPRLQQNRSFQESYNSREGVFERKTCLNMIAKGRRCIQQMFWRLYSSLQRTFCTYNRTYISSIIWDSIFVSHWVCIVWMERRPPRSYKNGLYKTGLFLFQWLHIIYLWREWHPLAEC